MTAGHQSLFRPAAGCNQIGGFLLGLVNAIPQVAWSAVHCLSTTATNGDWERYRGVADFLSSEDFARLDSKQQRRIYAAIAPSSDGLPRGLLLPRHPTAAALPAGDRRPLHRAPWLSPAQPEFWGAAA